MRRLAIALLLPAALFLAACGNSSNPSGGAGDGSLGGPSSTSSCQKSFSPEKVADGDDCAPVAGEYCPTIHYSGEPLPGGAAIPCDGVLITNVPITANGFTSNYLAIRRASGSPESVYLNLHYLAGPINVNANQLRLTELAVARNALILVPQAPSLTTNLLPPGTVELPTGELVNPFLPGFHLELNQTTTLSAWPNDRNTEPVADYEAFLDAVVADGRDRYGGNGKPLYVSGYSNGAVMALFYACDRPNAVRAFLGTATNVQPESVDNCPAVGAVLVHGSDDSIAPYAGRPLQDGPEAIYDGLRTSNDCTGTDHETTRAATGGDDDISTFFRWTSKCGSGNRIYLVKSIGGGHTWPSQDDDTNGEDFNTFGPISRNWDATIYGYDLLRLAGGD